MPKASIEREVNDKITEVGLTARAHYYACALSGGMQRKLSVAMALVGGSKVVFLGKQTTHTRTLAYTLRCLHTAQSLHQVLCCVV